MHELEIKYIDIHAMRLRDSVLMACVHVKHDVKVWLHDNVTIQ